MSLEKSHEISTVQDGSKKPLFGIVKFSPSLCCAANTLGCSVDVSVGGIKGTLTLPSLPDWGIKEEDPLHMPLLGPGQARTWKQGEELIFWGKPHSYPDGESAVEQALFQFQVEPENFESNAERIYNGFGPWLDLFEKYVILISTQGRCSRVTVKNSRANQISLLHYEESKFGFKHITYPQSVTVNIAKGGDLQREQFEEISRMCSDLLPPRLEYLLLLEAYLARKDKDYRKAIIEAANALEVSLTNRILEEFKFQGVVYGEKILDKYRMLGGRFELAKTVGIPLPDKDYKKLILEPRNNVVHKAGFPDEKLAHQVISEVQEVLRLFSPIIHEAATLPQIE
jgi:hypothetical protein